MKILLMNKYSCLKCSSVCLLTGALIVSFAGCKTDKTDSVSSGISLDSDVSSTVSIYYKDEDSSSTIYEDIITEGSAPQESVSHSDNLAEDVKPQLIIPNKTETASGNSNYDGVTTSYPTSNKDNNSSKPVNSSQVMTSNSLSVNSMNSNDSVSSQNSVVNSQTMSEDDVSDTHSSPSKDNVDSTQSSEEASGNSSKDVDSEETTSSTPSYDKGYTKPY